MADHSNLLLLIDAAEEVLAPPPEPEIDVQAPAPIPFAVPDPMPAQPIVFSSEMPDWYYFEPDIEGQDYEEWSMESETGSAGARSDVGEAGDDVPRAESETSDGPTFEEDSDSDSDSASDLGN